jgi:hypothetical protein
LSQRDSSILKTFTSLTFSPTIFTGIVFNTALTHLALKFLTASNKIKARDPRTLLNVFKDAPGHVPTQMLHYLEGFYGYLWENWTKSAEKTLGYPLQKFNSGFKAILGVPEDTDIYNQIINRNGHGIPGPNPSPTSCQAHGEETQVGIV